MKTIKTLILRFDNILEKYEISLFRGAVIASLENKNIFFHNHDGNQFRYSYPLIQYKRLHKKATIVCIGEGTEAIGEFFLSGNFSFRIGDREVEMIISDVQAERTIVQCCDDSFEYRIRDWLPLNSQNYEAYYVADGIISKIRILEKVLNGNILSILKGLDIHIDTQMDTKIIKLSEPRIVSHKGVKLMCFDIEFKSNISLPDYIGVGKNASVGYGMLTRKYNEKQ